MKSSKLVIAISELWNEKQLTEAKNCLLRGFEEINKKIEISDLIDHLKTKETKSEIYESEILINVNKVTLLDEIKNSSNYQSLLLLYVGPVSLPWGNWLLCDGIVSASDVILAMNDKSFKLVTSTLAPGDDWLAAEKKNVDILSVCTYDINVCSDPVVLGLNEYIDDICKQLTITPCNIKRSDSLSFLKATEPSVCGFLDKSSSAMPCLVLIDGFTMLFNVGYGRNPQVRHQLKYIAQLDAALLSHVSYNNLLALSCSAQDPDTVKINHLFLPHGVSSHGSDHDNPFIVDLNTELSKVIAGYTDRGTSVSHLSVKAKIGVPLNVAQVKPIQLYHKIGYGSLELIPLAPYEDDADLKRFSEDFKKGKHSNEGQAKPLPSSLSVLLIWRPFNHKVATKRFLYIGPRSPLRKTLPAMVTALYNNIECLKQADHLSTDLGTKKPAPRKAAPAVATTTAAIKVPTKVNGVAPAIEKSTRPATASDAIKKHSGTSSASNGDKPQRPSTANVPSATQKVTKDVSSVPTKKPTPRVAKTDEIKKTEVGKPVVHDTKKTEAVKLVHDPKKTEHTKVHDTKKTEPIKSHDTKKTDPPKVHDIKRPEQAKAHVPKKTDSNTVHEPKKTQQKIATMTASKKTTVKVDVNVKEECHGQEVPVVHNGEKEHSKEDVAVHQVVLDMDVLPDPGKMVAVGTVECAITEHGEADICDESPDDEEKSCGAVSDRCVDGGGADSDAGAVLVSGTGDVSTGSLHQVSESPVNAAPWNEPMGLPGPARAAESATSAKKTTKCTSPIHVDCVCVPWDLEAEDLRCLFNCVRFKTGFVQLEKCGDLGRVLDVLVEEWAADAGTKAGCTVLPSVDDEATGAWVHANEGRLASAKVTVGAALSRCTILIGGERGDDGCYGYRCDL